MDYSTFHPITLMEVHVLFEKNKIRSLPLPPMQEPVSTYFSKRKYAVGEDCKNKWGRRDEVIEGLHIAQSLCSMGCCLLDMFGAFL